MQTVSDILSHLNQQILRTRCNLDLLQSLRDRIADAVERPPADAPSVPSGPSPEPAPAPPVPTRRRQTGARNSTGSIFSQIVKAVVRLQGTITTKALAGALPGIRGKLVSDALNKLKRNGQLISTGYGAYAKTDKFAGSSKEADYATFRAGLNVSVPEVQLKSPDARSKAV